MGGKPTPMLFTGSRDKTVKIWDVVERRCKATLKGHESGVWNLLHKRVGDIEWLFSCSFDRAIRVSSFLPRLLHFFRVHPSEGSFFTPFHVLLRRSGISVI
jgi:WD40 repeat protein